MEQRLVYEQLIAGKLEQLPVPDMADVIWARIEQQLDIDLPTDDGGSNYPEPSAPPGTGPIGWGLSVLVVALITAFLLYKNRPQTNQPETQRTPLPIEQTQPPAQNNTSPPESGIVVNKTVNKISRENLKAGNLNAAQDSAIQQPVVAVPLNTPDSIKTVSTQPPQIVPLAKDTINTTKKRRGVRGITDDDYRIVPTEKDSS